MIFKNLKILCSKNDSGRIDENVFIDLLNCLISIGNSYVSFSRVFRGVILRIDPNRNHELNFSECRTEEKD